MKPFRNGIRATYAAAITSLVMMTQAQALTFESPYNPFQHIRTSKVPLYIKTPKLELNQRFRLFQKGRSTFDQAVQNALQNRINPIIEVRNSAQEAMSLVQGSEIENYRFYVANVPICNAQVKAHLNARGEAMIIGATPDVHSRHLAFEWPQEDVAVDAMTAALEESGISGNIKVTNQKRCFFVRSGSLENVWQIHLTVNGMPYRGWSDAYEAYGFERAFFDVDGSAKIYPAYPDSSAGLVDTPIVDLIGDGTLTSDYLLTDPRDQERVNESTHIYNYSPNDMKYAEVATFVYTQQHQKYFESIGFLWYGPKPLIIKAHEKPNGDPNNALFMPAEGGAVDYPTIFVGDGDGAVLDNLGRDADVVRHEFGHHVIYKNLKSTRGESLILHEGLADFFVFAKSGDSCLGESICPAGSQICWVEQCLRTASNQLVYGDTYYTHSPPHQKGQLVSGYLWDMHLANTVPLADLEKMVLRAIDLLVEDSGLEHFMLALFNADQELYQAKYHSQLTAAAETRGLSEFIEKVGPAGDPIPLPEDVEQSNGSVLGPSDSKEETKKDDDIFDKLCGTIGRGGSLQSLGMLLLFMLPLACAGLLPERSKVVVKNRKR